MSEREQLEQAREIIKQQSELLERLGKAAQPVGIVLQKLPGKKALIAIGGTPTIVEDPKVEPGKMVTVLQDTGQVMAIADLTMFYGDVLTITKVLPSGAVTVTVQGNEHVVLPGLFKDLKPFDKVLLDGQKLIVIDVIERYVPPKPKLAEPVQWSEIGGNDEAKAMLREAIEWPRKHGNLFRAYGAAAPAGALLYGPPGCGKTLLGKAVATAVGTGKAGGFFSIKGPEVLDPYVGVTEATIRDIFRKARDYYEAEGHEAVIFIDEADALLTARSTHGNYMGQTVVPAFLTEMDGLESKPAIVVLSTNRPDTLDPAITRDGRIDFKVGVKRPSQNEAVTIVNIYLKKTRVAHEGLAELAADRLYEGTNAKLPHSGALLAGVVAKAKSFAMRRDIDSTSGRATGIRKDDMNAAIDQTVMQELAVNTYNSNNRA